MPTSRTKPEQLLAAIRIVACADALLSPAITKRVIKQFARIPQPAPPKQLDDLTQRELDVFRLVAHALSNTEIGRELCISDTTVKTHITHILQKLSLRDRVQAVVLAYETGFSTPTHGRRTITTSARLAERLRRLPSKPNVALAEGMEPLWSPVVATGGNQGRLTRSHEPEK